jgi:hypothetical protein
LDFFNLVLAVEVVKIAVFVKDTVNLIILEDNAIISMYIINKLEVIISNLDEHLSSLAEN